MYADEKRLKVYERRIKRIEENPDPKYLRSTKLFYELERQFCIDRLQGFKEGKPLYLSMVARGMLAAMGFMHADVQRAAMGSTADSAALFDMLRAAGLPDDGCDTMTIPLALYMKGEAPLPALTVVGNYTCDPGSLLWMNALGRMFDIPTFCLDFKLEATYDSIRYVADQLGELIEFAESKVPGVKYDEDRLIELQELDRQAFGCLRDVYQAKRRVPCPTAGRDSFRMTPLPSAYTDPHKALEWYRANRDEVLERADKGISAVADEKLRFAWTVAGPIYANPWEYLEKRGVSVPVYIGGGTAKRYVAKWGEHGDETEFGRKLTPLEEEARMAHNSYGSVGKVWVDDVIGMCKDLKIDGIVNFLQAGCPTSLGLAKSVADAAEKCGILTLQIEGRNIDVSSYNQQQFEAKLGGFIDLCLARKGIN